LKGEAGSSLGRRKDVSRQKQRKQRKEKSKEEKEISLYSITRRSGLNRLALSVFGESIVRIL
jgi:hypothetical protein